MRTQKEAIPERLRMSVFRRDGQRCRYCGDVDGPFQLDHVYPESKGGITSFENLAVICKKCNNKKHAKIGIWPKPVGYFDEKETAERNEARRRNTLLGVLYNTIRISMVMSMIGALMVFPAFIPQLEMLRNNDVHITGAIIFSAALGIELSATAIERKI